MTVEQLESSMTEASILFDKKLSAELVGVYYDAMKDFPDEKIKMAFKKYFKTGKFFPRPADIIEIINAPRPGWENFY